MLFLDYSPAMPPKACGQAIVCPKIEVGAWNTVRPEKAIFTQRAYHKEEKCKGVSSFQKVVPISCYRCVHGTCFCILALWSKMLHLT